ncbi:hypothetical protein LYNGBM3L_38970 [Moorena producens 3L]|uniref:Uncharacterized protein n=1 Tax=Moorena producens 3L TaxID=489825 RepID=F4XVB3_9CYAN|nr:hypothetical protein LYNGBM3L_38970 [Moorena producens 3L]
MECYLEVKQRIAANYGWGEIESDQPKILDNHWAELEPSSND